MAASGSEPESWDLEPESWDTELEPWDPEPESWDPELDGLNESSGSEDGLNESTLHPVWRKLSEELVEIVLKCVPFESLVRFRTVCKRFNNLITSPKSARKCQRQQASKPVPVLVPQYITRDSCPVKVFNNKTNSWLPCHLPTFKDDLYPLKMTAASGGLVCFETIQKGFNLASRKFVVYNLLTRAFKHLEPLTPDENRFHGVRAFTSLVVDRQAGTFTLVVVTSSTKEAGRRTFLYNSVEGSWRSGAPLPEMPCFDRHTSFDTGTSDGNVYACLNSGRFSAVLKYDVRSDRWSQVSLDNARYAKGKGLEILEHRCNVLLVSIRTRHRRPNELEARQQKIFYMVREAAAGQGETVKEDKKVFQALDEDELTYTTETVATVGVGDVICITRREDYRSPMRVLYFNCSTQKRSFLTEMDDERFSVVNNFHLLEPSFTVDL